MANVEIYSINIGINNQYQRNENNGSSARNNGGGNINSVMAIISIMASMAYQ
jgi:hypothetical protein